MGHPDRDMWYGYVWPATRLTDEHRRHLNLMSNARKVPVTQLIAEAVEQMYETFEAGQEIPQVAAEEPPKQKLLFE